MKMMPNLTVLIFGVLSLLFAFFSVRDYLRNKGKLSPSARVWRRIAIIFAVVALVLMIIQ
ncbi:hypothetical protein [Methylobacter sp. BlB1]|uniref:hypothetical protein n=1 Tax=Methylobacter sp. BlB1 TaxID=2785914 RepID=UPI001893CC6B|nr:hypothetical protein [Methylobacter sp. BlB1]MBF6649864.1 hypothetical protein [Methylobacter sp. BlB1]